MRQTPCGFAAVAALLLSTFPVQAGDASGTIVTGKNPEYKLQISGKTNAPNQKVTYTGLGQVLLKGPLLVTSGAITGMSASSVQIGKASFGVAGTSKLCGEDGAPLTAEAFKVGDKVKITSAPGKAVVQTLRKGLIQFFGSPPQLDLVKTHLCA